MTRPARVRALYKLGFSPSRIARILAISEDEVKVAIGSKRFNPRLRRSASPHYIVPPHVQDFWRKAGWSEEQIIAKEQEIYLDFERRRGGRG